MLKFPQRGEGPHAHNEPRHVKSHKINEIPFASVRLMLRTAVFFEGHIWVIIAAVFKKIPGHVILRGQNSTIIMQTYNYGQYTISDSDNK